MVEDDPLHDYRTGFLNSDTDDAIRKISTRDDIPPSLIREYLTYEDGHLYWKRNPRVPYDHPKSVLCDRGPRIGGITRNQGKYPNAMFFGIRVHISHLIWAHHRGEWPKGRLHYRDDNPENTRIENLHER